MKIKSSLISYFFLICCISCTAKLTDNLTSQNRLEQLLNEIELDEKLRESIFAVNAIVNSEYTMQLIPRNTDFPMRGPNENGYLLLCNENELEINNLKRILETKFPELELEPRVLLMYPVNSNTKSLDQKTLDANSIGSTNYLHIGLDVSNVVKIYSALISHLNPHNDKIISFNINKRDDM